MEPSSPPDFAEGSTEVAFRPFAFASATTIFVLIGTTGSLYGPLLISFSHKFHLSLPVAGVVVSVHFIGALCGVPIGWLAMRRFHGNLVLAAALVLMAAGAVGAALAGHWTMFLASVFVIGLGFGGVDFSLNSLLVRTSIQGRAHRLSLANAGYGLGAVIGPVLVIAIHPRNFPLIFGGVGAVAVILSTTNRGVRAPLLHAEARRHAFAARNTRRQQILITFIVAYVLYVAVESSSAGWIAPQLHRVGFSQTVAGLATAGFWLGLTLGRVAGGPLHRRFSERHLVLASLVVAAVLSASAVANSVAPYAYPLAGLALASVYPMGLMWYTVLCPHDADGFALLVLFMMGGGVVGPAVVSLMVSIAGIHAVPLVIASFAVADLAVFASALRFAPERT